MKEAYSLVTVTKVETYVDINGRRGKRIEFTLIKPNIEEEPYTPETRIVKEVVTQLKNLGFPMLYQQQRSLKLILYILPEEEKALGLDFKVNNIYRLIFSDKGIKFEDVTDEYYLME